MKTAMQDLKDDLLETIIVGKEAFNLISDEKIKSACKATLEETIKTIITRIDTELLQIEHAQIIKAFNEGWLQCNIYGLTEKSRKHFENPIDYYNHEYKTK